MIIGPPPSHPLYGCDARIARAERHLAELATEFAQLTKDLAAGIRAEAGDDGVVRPVHRGEPPGLRPMISVICGEIIYNLRAALDYLVYALASTAQGKPVERTQFPIVGALEDFKRLRPTYLNGVPDQYADRIELLQPYHEDAKWMGLLRDISNPDKHRHLSATLANASASVTSLEAVPNDPGAEKFEVDVKMKLQIDVAFEDSGLSVGPTLEFLKNQVALVIDAFKGEFKPRPVA